MVLKFLTKIESLFYQWYNKQLFKKTNCNLKALCIGPEYYKNFNIRYPKNLSIGDGTVINGDCMINAVDGVKIGRHCHIAIGLTVYSHNHNFKSEEFVPYDHKELPRPVEIGDAVWIGANVTIAPGAKIGHGVIISSGSVVFGDIPDCAIIRGNSAEIIKYRDKEMFWKLYNEGRFS
jgi:acetyltransferase-like isoleucine patch superfamily enzyme